MTVRLAIAALDVLEAAHGQEFHPDASVMLTMAKNVWQEFRDAAAEAVSTSPAKSEGLLTWLADEILSCLAQEKNADGDAVSVQFAAGHYEGLKQAVVPEADPVEPEPIPKTGEEDRPEDPPI